MLKLLVKKQLSEIFRSYFYDAKKNKKRSTGTTILFITHNIEEAVYLAEKILVLTNKPTKVRELVADEIPRPRDIADPEFVDLRNRVTDLIKWW